MIPPLILYLRWGENRFGFWLPVFLVWLLLLPPLLLAVLLFWVLAGPVLLWIHEGRILLGLPFHIYELACAMRGLQVRVQDGTKRLTMILY